MTRVRLEDLPPELRDQVNAKLGNVSRGTAKAQLKYRNHVIEVDGRRFGSKWELQRWGELQEQQAAGLIGELRHQVAFALHAMGPLGDFGRIGSYVADFVYRRSEQLVVEDTKSAPTRQSPIYVWKRKHFEIEYGLRIVEVLRAPRRHG